jgi:hypothetical protein
VLVATLFVASHDEAIQVTEPSKYSLAPFSSATWTNAEWREINRLADRFLR